MMHFGGGGWSMQFPIQQKLMVQWVGAEGQKKNQSCRRFPVHQNWSETRSHKMAAALYRYLLLTGRRWENTESPQWDSDADRLAPLRPTHLVYKVIGFFWWLLVPLTPRSISAAQYEQQKHSRYKASHPKVWLKNICTWRSWEQQQTFFFTFNNSHAVVVDMDNVCSLLTLNEASQKNWEPRQGQAEHWDGASNSCCMCTGPGSDYCLSLCPSVHHSDPPSGLLLFLFFTSATLSLPAPLPIRYNANVKGCKCINWIFKN